MKTVNIHASSRSSPNACTDCTTPDRVMNVPKIVRKNVTMTSETFQTFSIAAPLLHHHRVQEGRRREPRQQAGVLDRIPAPVAAPAQLFVRPERAERRGRPSGTATRSSSSGAPRAATSRRAGRSRARRCRTRTESSSRRSRGRASADGSPCRSSAAAGSVPAPVGRRRRRGTSRTGCCESPSGRGRTSPRRTIAATTHGIRSRCRSRLTYDGDAAERARAA